MLRSTVIALGALACLSGAAFAADLTMAPPPAPYEKASKAVKLPEFLPGLGALYVDPKTLPYGPWLAYDHNNKLVSTIYMIPLKDMTSQKKIEDLHPPGGEVVNVELYYNAGHPGVPMPHYHVILWHVVDGDKLVEK
jgi:hypothetical protein